MMVIRSEDGTTRSTERSGGISGKMRLDKKFRDLSRPREMGVVPVTRYGTTQSAEEPGWFFRAFGAAGWNREQSAPYEAATL